MSIMAIVSWAVFGLVVGAIARLLMPGRQPLGCLLTTALGIVGSFVGGGVASLIFGPPQSFFHPSGWILSIIGAMLVLFIYVRLFAPR